MEICCDIDRLVRQPQLRDRYDSYVPPDETIDALRAIDEPMTVAVVYGFWCPDSVRIVPGVLKCITEADNDNLQVLGATVPLEETDDLPLDVGGISVRWFPTVAFLRGRFQTTEEIDPDAEVVRFVEEPLDASRLGF
jgi:hypothetical protein